MAYTTINKSTAHFNTKLFTGTGSTNAQTGVGFQPDMVWFKNRSETYSHQLYDVVRGVTKRILPDLTTAEETDANGLTAFGTDGFTVGSNVGVNKSSNNICSWNWKAGTGQGSSNTDGSINTTYTSVNTTAGFSISKYTGTGANATVGHGLGVAPRMIIFKNLDQGSEGWFVYHESIGNTKRLLLNDTSATSTSSTFYQDTSPTSSVFSVGSNHGCNGPHNMIAYCFAEKTGYSKFGSYIGNNASTFVYTGFKPKFLLLKNSSEVNGWLVLDAKRTTSNPMGAYVYANANSAEGTVTYVDFLSNGFRLVSTSSVAVNKNGNTFVYAAFGQSLVGSNNIPATAR